MTEQQTNGRIAASDGAQGCAAAGTLRAEELAELTAAAQRGERQAIDRLCAAFAPLVKKEAHADAVYRALGEDAENAAWVLFLELIQKPGRQTGASYPGFLKKSLHLGLLKQVIRQSSLAEREVSGEKADALLEAGGGTGCGDIELRWDLLRLPDLPLSPELKNGGDVVRGKALWYQTYYAKRRAGLI